MSHLQRWALTLASYEYTIVYCSTTQHANADALSWLPLPQTPRETPTPEDIVLSLEMLRETPVTVHHIKQGTRKDPILLRVLQYCKSGWGPSCKMPEIIPYWHRQEELSLQDGCILWGNRVVIPPGEHMELHSTHMGVSKMKAVACSLMWWPGIDTQIEQLGVNCVECQQDRNMPAEVPLSPWAWPTKPWSRMHVDYAGPINNHMLFIVIDAHSKWIEVGIMTTITAEVSQVTIRYLQQLFARFGLPDTLVSDNGPSLVSQQF